MAHPAESGHWYYPDGEPCYEVEAAKGGMRPTTLRDARKLGLYPSVTSIIRQAAAPGLERWKADQLMMAALTLPRLLDEPESAWLDRVRVDSQEQARKAAERGTAIHKAIQGWFEGEPMREGFEEHISGVANALIEQYGEQEWFAEKSFAHPLGFGGKTDAFSQAALVDFKTKEFSKDSKLDIWDEQAMQLAANRQGQGIPDSPCAIVYVSTLVPGFAKLIEVETDDLQRGWEMFVNLLRFYQAKTGYHVFQEFL